MLQEDSNGDNSFEIIEQKQDESSNTDKTETMSSVSSPFSLPSPGGNLLSNLPPPTNLPDFTLWQNPVKADSSPSSLPPTATPLKSQDVKIGPTITQPYPQPEFSAAIPPSKGVQHGPVPPTIDSGQQGLGVGLIGWMKEAVSSGGILSKVAEKAKSSVDTLITTLDPQMSEFIYTGGDIEFSVASLEPDEIAAVREAIFVVFGKAWVNVATNKVDDHKHQAVGFADSISRAEEKLKSALQIQKIPTIAIENILLQQDEQWFDLSVILLRDEQKNIDLRTFSQMTLIPQDSFLKLAEKEFPTYPKGGDSTEKLLSAYLKVSKNAWQHRVCGVTRKEMIFLAAKSLITIYKNKIAVG